MCNACNEAIHSNRVRKYHYIHEVLVDITANTKTALHVGVANVDRRTKTDLCNLLYSTV